MNLEEARARIKARVWQALAQSELDIKDLPQSELEELVNLMATAALVEIDEELGESLTSEETKENKAGDEDSAEQILWQGRPFLSINTRYQITDERVRIIEGVLGKDHQDIELVRIQDVDQSQTVRERLLNVGDIHIHSHDRSHPRAVLNNVKNPQQVHEILRRAVLKARERYKLVYREEM
ncbi:MAG TPA: PH domain-containing protein [Candidatus Sulfomarinibacteraceae bacterium]|nr:PH domain-containing protein [Candidatus Sulfomarinibacteraceae bacterium]